MKEGLLNLVYQNHSQQAQYLQVTSLTECHSVSVRYVLVTDPSSPGFEYVAYNSLCYQETGCVVMLVR